MNDAPSEAKKMIGREDKNRQNRRKSKLRIPQPVVEETGGHF